MGITTDPNSPCLRELDDSGQQICYLVLSEEEREKGFIRPVRDSYKHLKCGTTTRMGSSIAETYARNNLFYSGTYCCYCKTHFHLLIDGERQFAWYGSDGKLDGTFVGE